jgi:hypothetical protein
MRFDVGFNVFFHNADLRAVSVILLKVRFLHEFDARCHDYFVVWPFAFERESECAKGRKLPRDQSLKAASSRRSPKRALRAKTFV